MSIKIILADDHKLLREGLSSLLKKQAGFEVVAEAENGRAAVQFTQKYLPDVVVMDISMSDLNGIDATRQIVAKNPTTKVIGLSMHSDRQFAVEMMRAGASGYMLKDSAFEEVITVINTVVKGQTYIHPKIGGVALSDYASPASRKPLEVPRLTEREREVLQLLAEGKGTKEIAADLFLSAKTVETHRQHLMDKLEMYTVAELTKYAIREGLTTLDH